jgi:hypothetical protein
MARRPINVTIRDNTGVALVAAVVIVRVHSSGALATVYADENTASPLPGSQTITGANGFVSVWVDDSDYNLFTMFDVYGILSGYSIPTKTVNV